MTDGETKDAQSPVGSTLVRRASIRATDAERAAVKRCLAAVELQAKKRQGEGLSATTFFLGVVNSHLVVFVFAKLPQHFWVLYMFEAIMLFPIRFIRMYNTKPLSTTRYLLDFCFIANFLGNATLLALIVDDYLSAKIFDDELRRTVFCAYWGIANGPLLLATGLLGNALVFHDPDNTISLFIHLFPALLMYTMRWHRDQVLNAWPGLFDLDYYDGIRPWQDIYVKATICYGCWWVLYTLWLLACGMHLPQSGTDTVFHWAMRGAAGNVVAKVTGCSAEERVARAKTNDFSRRDALVYLTLHAIAVCVALTVGVASFYSWRLHAALIAAMALVATYNGASRYSHYLLRSYGDIIRREIGIDD